MMYVLIFIIFICVKPIFLQVTLPTANTCFAKVPQSNCAYIKQCNTSLGAYLATVYRNAPCLQASGNGALSVVNQPPFLQFTFDLTKLQSSPLNETTGFCECSVCSQQCGNLFATDTRCNRSCSQKQSDQMSLTDTMSSLDSIIPTSSGTGGVCFSIARTNCVAIVFCDFIIDLLGIPVRLVDLLPVCFDASNTNMTLGPGTFSLSLPISSNQTSCPCTACSGACAQDPLLGCPTGYNNSTPSPSTTQCPVRTTTTPCPARTTTSATCG